MLVIRAEQFEALHLGHLRSSATSLADRCRQEFGPSAPPRLAAEDRALTDAAIVRAWHHGFRTTRDVHAFARLAFLLGLEFDRHPSIDAILAVSSRTPEQKMRAILSAAAELLA